MFLITAPISKVSSARPVAQLGRVLAPLHHARNAILEHQIALSMALMTCPSKSGKPTRPFVSTNVAHSRGIFPVEQTRICQNPSAASARSFSTTRIACLRDFFPAHETKFIRQTPAAWSHRGYTEEEMLSVVPAHREPKTLGDRFAWKLIRICRWCMDFATGLRPEQQVDKKKPTTEVVASKPLTEAQWLVRFVFLESIAGVPGMVAGMLRHLRSLRRLKRDNGWIETLLEESYNERMHLLTFMKMCEPGWFMKFMIVGAQGVFFNALFASYLVSPKICHRFVGYLEEEAVHTYTRCIREIDEGLLTKWSDKKFTIPDLAVGYWKIPEGKRTMKDLILYIRADEAVHRGVNHTLSNLNYREDPNPFVSDYKVGMDSHKPDAVRKATGYEREEVIG
ncbi:alternative oxidase, mitochondrial [Rhinocladiella mackenziei CBS 650.93]|uniref:Alternative oxidase n=1 Tax=Rhinocladiella mackenziei CBS 650.93 TaxID=1442369 RepID=A0A0D2G4F6_9EURO|nr:alternative oxidase, mitochondrial [Rhinocladiella mackenziei CBS 650.93]KIX09547.1 alternative oxidase, mitochondrial [Rhinocladiella mackenziei CBS 650.93]